MSLQRIRFASSAAPATSTTLNINPSEMLLVDSKDQMVVQTLDGPSVVHESEFDGRPRSLVWRGFALDHTGFSSLLATLNNYVSHVFYVHYGDADYRQLDSTSWNKVRMSDLQTKIRPGGKVKYDECRVTLLPMPN